MPTARRLQPAANDNARGPGPEELRGRDPYLEYTFASAGTYYLGVSSAGNTAYDPATGEGDTADGTTGACRLIVSPGIAGTARKDGEPTDYPVDIIRLDLQALDPNLRTWIVIHGRGSSRTEPNIAEVSGAIARARPHDQVATLDWSEAASATGLLNFSGEDAIQNVGAWAASALRSRGFSGSNLNLVGHSWGSYVADELAERIGGVNSIIALDAAENVLGGYSPETPGEIDFARNSLFSWAFHSDGSLGSNVTPPTADEAFVVTNSDHTSVIYLFANLLLNPTSVVGRLFDLAILITGSFGPWVPDMFTSKLPILLWFTEDEIGGYEGVITAGAGSTNAESIRFVTNAPVIRITSHQNGATVAGSPITLRGTATDAGRGESGIGSVLVNGVRANQDTATGSGVANWSSSIALVPGANLITVIARDQSPRQASATNKVTIVFAPPVQPTLVMVHQNNTVLLSWDVRFSSFVAQFSFDLSKPNWVDLPSSAVVMGSSNVVTVSLEELDQYFRLVRR